MHKTPEVWNATRQQALSAAQWRGGGVQRNLRLAEARRLAQHRRALRVEVKLAVQYDGHEVLLQSHQPRGCLSRMRQKWASAALAQDSHASPPLGDSSSKYPTSPPLRQCSTYVNPPVGSMAEGAPLCARASAPGKLILFGEHAVVYGKTAVAAALSDLRVFVTVVRAGGVGAVCAGLHATSLAGRHLLPHRQRDAA